MKSFKIVLNVVIFLMLSVTVWGAVPNLINFQGVLTDSLGNPVADGNYSVSFKIYDAQSGGSILWQESLVVSTSKGTFTSILGSATALPSNIFQSDQRWLGIKIGNNPEISPRSRLVSTPFTFVGGKADSATNADLLDGLNSTDFLNVTSDFGRSGISSDLYEGSSTLSDKYVNATGPESVVSTSGSAFLGKVSGSDTGSLIGISGRAENASASDASGGEFGAFGFNGPGKRYGIRAVTDGSGSTNYANYDSANGNFGSSPTYGTYSVARNTSSGNVYGGLFKTLFSGGTGTHFGVRGEAAYGSSSAPSYGVFGLAENASGDAFGSYGSASNFSTGNAIGGHFTASSSGTGTHYGVRGIGLGSSSSSTYGAFGSADNTSTGEVFGGYFQTSSSGSGNHYGVRGAGLGSSSAGTYGSYGIATNTSTGPAYGGLFTAGSSGTGIHTGVFGGASGTSSASTYGAFGSASNSSTGIAYAGYFDVLSAGTGAHYGVYGVETAGGSGAAVYAAGDFAGSGAKYAVAKTSQGNRLLSVIEAPEVWFEDFGEGQMVNGKAHIELDPLFLETVTINASNPMKVFIQLNDPDCKGTAVVRGTTGFDVVELQNGTSKASFSYRIVAKRKGYENQRLLQTTLGMDDPNLYPELWQEMEKRQQEAKFEGNLEK